MNKNEKIESGTGSSEKETVVEWLRELDSEIRKGEQSMKFDIRHFGADSLAVKERLRKLQELRDTRKQYEKLLADAENKKP